MLVPYIASFVAIVMLVEAGSLNVNADSTLTVGVGERRAEAP
jgi:hypothetical protein